MIDMGISRQRKFVCLDCDEHTYFTRLERSRRARMNCISCGSYRLEPATIGAKRDILKKNEVRTGTTARGTIVSKLKLKTHKTKDNMHGELDNRKRI